MLTPSKLQSTTPYALDPISIEDGIPVFSRPDDYQENYARIANDHLAYLASNGENPFIPERLWNEIEESTVRLLRKYTKDGDRILDAGVGLGRLLSHVPSLQRYGVDISADYLQRARNKGIDVALAKIEDLPYCADFFDAITCTDVFEHVLDLNLCVGKLLNVLKPGGILLVRVPYKEDLAPYTKRDYPYNFAHLRNFDEHSLTLYFTKVFRAEVVKWSTAGQWPTIDRLEHGHFAPTRLALRVLAKGLRAHSGLRNSWLARWLFLPVEINFLVRKP